MKPARPWKAPTPGQRWLVRMSWSKLTPAQQCQAWLSSLSSDRELSQIKLVLPAGLLEPQDVEVTVKSSPILIKPKNLTNQRVASYYWRTCKPNRNKQAKCIRNETNFRLHKSNKNLNQLLLFMGSFLRSLNPVETINNSS